jgi:hypothetical protein
MVFAQTMVAIFAFKDTSYRMYTNRLLKKQLLQG